MTHTYIHTYIYIYIYIYIHIYIHTPICIYTYIHIHIYLCTHVYIYTHHIIFSYSSIWVILSRTFSIFHSIFFFSTATRVFGSSSAAPPSKRSRQQGYLEVVSRGNQKQLVVSRGNQKQSIRVIISRASFETTPIALFWKIVQKKALLENVYGSFAKKTCQQILYYTGGICIGVVVHIAWRLAG